MEDITLKDIEKLMNKIECITYVSTQNKALILFYSEEMWHINMSKSSFNELQDKFLNKESKKLGIIESKKYSRKNWTKEEIKYISTTSDSIYRICLKLDRNYYSVKNKLKQISDKRSNI